MRDELDSTVRSGSDGAQETEPFPSAFQRYHNVRYFKAGGQAKIYLAEDTRHEFGTVAIKVPAKADKQAVDCFLEETSVASSMNHPNVVQVLDSGKIDGQLPFLVMKFYASGALAELLARDPKRHWIEAVKIARQLAGAAQYVCEKRGLVHCDIKPQNILLDEKWRPHLADFGIVSANAGQPLGAVKGTWLYMSPEQASGGNVDARSDVWSIGVILYQMLCGRLPFQSDNLLSQIAGEEPVPPRQLDGRIPPALEHVVFKCLKKCAADRYSSPIELAEALQAVESARWRKPLLAVAVLLLVLAGGAWVRSQSSGRDDVQALSHNDRARKDSSSDANVPPKVTLPDSLRDIPATAALTEVLTGSPPGASNTSKRPELEFSIVVRHKGEKNWVDLKEGDALASRSDLYYLAARPLSDGYLYIFQVDSLGNQSWLFPKNVTMNDSSGENPVRAGKAVQAPAVNALFLDDNTGIERIIVVFSSVPWPRLVSLLLEQSANGIAGRAALSVEIGRLNRGVGGSRPRELTIEHTESGVAAEVSVSTEAVQATGTFLVLERRFRHVAAP